MTIPLLFDDYVVLFFLTSIDVFILVNIIYERNNKFEICFWGTKVYRDNFVFFLSIMLMILFVLLNEEYNFINRFLGIVNFKDLNDGILRKNIVGLFLIKVFAGGAVFSVGCAILAFNKKVSIIKWFVFGLFFNVVAFLYLIFLPKKSAE